MDSKRLLTDLACGSCHSSLPVSDSIWIKAPSLSYAGLRYNAAYLYEYLGNPTRIRRHIGRSRMPDFKFSEQERLALALYLEKQKNLVQPLPEFPQELREEKQENVSDAAARKLIVEELHCTSCHKLNGEGADVAVDLATIGWRLKSDWLKEYLAWPQAFDPQTSMPAQVYNSRGNNQLLEVVPNAAAKIRTMVIYLMSFGRTERARQERNFQRVRQVNPNISAALGENIFVSQNCTGCHALGSIQSWKNAPDLSRETARARQEWLKAYLTGPTPIRPFGFYPGTGSRMPDFKLTSEEVGSITEFFLEQSNPTIALPSFQPHALSRFSMQKAEKLIRDRLPCLGCHTLGKEGGKIGPDLSNVKERLQPEFVFAIIRDPQHIDPAIVMPKAPMQDATIDLITNYLITSKSNGKPTAYLSLIDNPLREQADTTDVQGLYAHYCSSCHGLKGNGDGFNAKFLSRSTGLRTAEPTQPTKHADKIAMSARADDALFDGIYAGGAILNKSHRMPAFGQTLSRNQIWSLVRYIRHLCGCEGPQWSRESTGREK